MDDRPAHPDHPSDSGYATKGASTSTRPHLLAPRLAQQRHHRQPAASWRERGAATAQLVIATPLLLFMLLLTVQFAVWFHAAHIAQATASQALAAARAQDGSAAAGREQANTLLAQLGTGLLIDPQVSVTRAGGQVLARITGTVQAIVPGLHLPVRAVAAGPVDAWTTP